VNVELDFEYVPRKAEAAKQTQAETKSKKD